MLVDEFQGCLEEGLLLMIDKNADIYSELFDDEECEVSEQWFDSLLDDNSACVDTTNDRSIETVCEIGKEGVSIDIEKADSPATDRMEATTVKQELELKELPQHLKYAFLGEEPREKPVVISSKLQSEHEGKLVQLLKLYQKAIGWSLHDIVGISPAMCMHRIELEEGAKPVKESQRRLNPSMQAVVRDEVLKLLKEGIIFPVATSEWVSPVHVVPKKGGVTVELNAKGEEVAVRKTTGWRMCIDFRKLNQATKNDHFPLPFVDQMLERLAGFEYYCLLDGLSGYYQIHIDPRDQNKTTFTCSSGTFAFRKMPFGLCNAPVTFQRCVLSIFSDMIGDGVEVFMDEFSISGRSFEQCLEKLRKVLQRCIDCNLTLSWEKC